MGLSPLPVPHQHENRYIARSLSLPATGKFNCRNSYTIPSKYMGEAMSTPVLETVPTVSSVIRSAVNVFIKNETDGTVSAMVLGLPEYRVESSDRQSAIAALQKLITAKLIGAEVVSLEIEVPQKENPWLKMAGKYKDDPHFDQMLESIAEYRREKDTELEEYYRQIEISENVSSYVNSNSEDRHLLENTKNEVKTL